MKSKNIQIIYGVCGILMGFFILQELFPILFTLPTTPNSYLILMNFPLITGIIAVIIPIITARSFIKSPIDEYKWLNSTRILYAIFLISALIALFLPYVSYNGIRMDIGIKYSIYGGLFGLILTIFGFTQLISNRIFFGFLIGTAGSTIAISGYLKFFLYILQQYNTRFEIGFYIGIIVWVLLLSLNLIFSLKSYTPNQILMKQ